jgi:hypothetical protein
MQRAADLVGDLRDPRGGVVGIGALASVPASAAITDS